FVARSLAEAWRCRWRYYLTMAMSWAVLTLLMRGLHGRGVGFGQGMSGWSYLLIECGAIVRYAGLALWPSTLVFDYGTDLGSPAALAVISALGLLLLGGGVLIALRRSPVK